MKALIEASMILIRDTGRTMLLQPYWELPEPDVSVLCLRVVLR